MPNASNIAAAPRHLLLDWPFISGSRSVFSEGARATAARASFLLYACAGSRCRITTMTGPGGERPMRNPVAALALAAAQCLLPGTALAQSYPSKPVRLLVGVPAGGPADIFGRTFAHPLSAGPGPTGIGENQSG